MSYILIPSGQYTDNMSAWTLEVGFYFNGYTEGGRLFAKDGVNGQFCVGLDEPSPGVYRLLIERWTSNNDCDTYSTPIDEPLVVGNWYGFQITWAFGNGPSGTNQPIAYLNPTYQGDYSILAAQATGTGTWDDDSGEPIYIGDESSLDLGFDGSIAVFRWYNYVVDQATLYAHYTADKLRWAGANTPISSTETVTLHLTETQTPESSGTTTYRNQDEVVTLATTETGITSSPGLDDETLTMVLTEDGVPDIQPPTETVTLITTETQAINAVSTEYVTLIITEVTTPQPTYKPIIDEVVYLELIEAEWVCVT